MDTLGFEAKLGDCKSFSSGLYLPKITQTMKDKGLNIITTSNGNGIDAKKAAIQAAMAQIQKQYGTGSIMRLGERAEKLTTDVISTGSIALDLALGVGGLPKGRIIEIYGPEASG